MKLSLVLLAATVAAFTFSPRQANASQVRETRTVVTNEENTYSSSPFNLNTETVLLWRGPRSGLRSRKASSFFSFSFLIMLNLLLSVTAIAFLIFICSKFISGTSTEPLRRSLAAGGPPEIPTPWGPCRGPLEAVLEVPLEEIAHPPVQRIEELNRQFEYLSLSETDEETLSAPDLSNIQAAKAGINIMKEKLIKVTQQARKAEEDMEKTRILIKKYEKELEGEGATTPEERETTEASLRLTRKGHEIRQKRLEEAQVTALETRREMERILFKDEDFVAALQLMASCFPASPLTPAAAIAAIAALRTTGNKERLRLYSTPLTSTEQQNVQAKVLIQADILIKIGEGFLSLLKAPETTHPDIRAANHTVKQLKLMATILKAAGMAEFTTYVHLQDTVALLLAALKSRPSLPSSLLPSSDPSATLPPLPFHPKKAISWAPTAQFSRSVSSTLPSFGSPAPEVPRRAPERASSLRLESSSPHLPLKRRVPSFDHSKPEVTVKMTPQAISFSGTRRHRAGEAAETSAAPAAAATEAVSRKNLGARATLVASGLQELASDLQKALDKNEEEQSEESLRMLENVFKATVEATEGKINTPLPGETPRKARKTYRHAVKTYKTVIAYGNMVLLARWLLKIGKVQAKLKQAATLVKATQDLEDLSTAEGALVLAMEIGLSCVEKGEGLAKEMKEKGSFVLGGTAAAMLNLGVNYLEKHINDVKGALEEAGDSCVKGWMQEILRRKEAAEGETGKKEMVLALSELQITLMEAEELFRKLKSMFGQEATGLKSFERTINESKDFLEAAARKTQLNIYI